MVVPKIRFKDYKGDWTKAKVDYFLERVVKPVKLEENVTYREVGVRSHGKGIFHKNPTTKEEIGKKRVFWVHSNAFIVNIVFAWEQAIAVTSEKDSGFIASHRFPMFVPRQNRSSVRFILKYFMRPYGKHLLGLASPGGAGRNKTLGQGEFAKLQITLPTLPEQEKISDFLDSVDVKIRLLNKKKVLLESHKIACLEMLFSGQYRFKDRNGFSFPDWKEKTLGEVLEYKQPTKHLVSSKNYSDEFATPVLTAGKTFILGYTDETDGIFKDTPAIIFDDFTTAFKFVDFPFKAKSSAMKILSLRENDNDINFIHAAMLQLKFQVSGHKRYWISEYQNEVISIPHPEEQKRISKFVLSLDVKIQLISEEIRLTQTLKNGLLQQMFI